MAYFCPTLHPLKVGGRQGLPPLSVRSTTSPEFQCASWSSHRSSYLVFLFVPCVRGEVCISRCLSYPHGHIGEPNGVAVGDLNGDRHVSMSLVADETIRADRGSLGNGDGTFQPAVTCSTASWRDSSCSPIWMKMTTPRCCCSGAPSAAQGKCLSSSEMAIEPAVSGDLRSSTSMPFFPHRWRFRS